MYLKALAVLSAVGLGLMAAACGGGGSGGSSSSYNTWIDTNRNNIYDPYEDSTKWSAMMSTTAGMVVAAQGSTNQNQYQIRHQWRDRNGDGICDYAQDRDQWRQVAYGDWIDENGDGVCDNYPGRPLDGTGQGWKGGWR